MLSLLEIVDNPPAGRASDLRPPVTPVRLHGGPAGGGSLRRPTGDYYDAVTADGGEDCKDFLAILRICGRRAGT